MLEPVSGLPVPAVEAEVKEAPTWFDKRMCVCSAGTNEHVGKMGTAVDEAVKEFLKPSKYGRGTARKMELLLQGKVVAMFVGRREDQLFTNGEEFLDGDSWHWSNLKLAQVQLRWMHIAFQHQKTWCSYWHKVGATVPEVATLGWLVRQQQKIPLESQLECRSFHKGFVQLSSALRWDIFFFELVEGPAIYNRGRWSSTGAGSE
jgi:hypothetical protein